ncbi:MAG: glycosyl hydrolase family 18 protein, partial [Ignavibacteria bacterium]|nr:glycosyl hydrolase family 18 protein [Ignavibacteria bacterium]
PPQNIKFENLTHIIHAFAWPLNNGDITMYSGMPNLNLNNAIHNAGKKILIAFGGWGQSDGFAPMAADSLYRTNFIENVVELLSQHDYDGIDLDWEFPANITEGRNLTTLVEELHERFNQENPDWLITMAVSAGSYNGQYLEYNLLSSNINWFSMMGYDFHGSWTTHAGHNAPLYQPSNCFDGASDIGIKYLIITRQVPKQKVLLGVPFYGKEFNAAGLYQSQSGVTDLTYTTVAPRINSSGWEYYWDDFSKVPYLLNTAHTKVVTFDDTVSIRVKCEYALDNQLSGMMIWALGQDIVGSSQPLLETIGREMGLVTSVETFPEQIAMGFYLFDNYPNPFNPSTKIEYLIPESSFVTLKVYDLLGREVATLVNEMKSKGKYEVNFDAANLGSGLYTYVLSSGNFFQSKKMMLLK